MASKRAKRRASCEGKVRHDSPGEARAHAMHLRKEHHNNGYDFYKCQFCGGWHVGRRNKSQKQSAKAKAKHKRKNRSRRQFFNRVLK